MQNFRFLKAVKCDTLTLAAVTCTSNWMRRKKEDKGKDPAKGQANQREEKIKSNRLTCTVSASSETSSLLNYNQ